MAMPESSKSESDAFYKLASVWRLRGHPDRAMSGYRSALAKDAGHLPACLELAAMLEERGDHASALACCQQAVTAHPDNRLLERRIEELRELSAKSCPNVSGASASESLVTKGAASRETILLYSDCAGMDGAEQCSHIIALALTVEGFRVVCAQPLAHHSLVAERARAGVQHVWIAAEGLYQASTDNPREGSSAIERLFGETQPDLVLFSDGFPFSSLLAKQVARRRGLPFIILNHCVNEDWGEQHAERLSELEEAFRSAAEVVAVSQRNLQDLRERFRLPPGKGRAIRNGRPERFFAPRNAVAREQLRAQLGIGSDAFVCVTVARMEVMKGYQYQLAAIERLMRRPVWNQLQFLWVGTGTLRERFRSRSAELGADRSIHFLGARNDIDAVLDAADMFALPSQYEGMPLSMIEAMARGLPVVATAVSGIPEALGDAGVLLPDPRKDAEGAIEGLVSSIENWACAGDRGVALGAVARARAAELFSAEKMASAYCELVRECLARRSRASS